jgi:hypothetical protein
MTGPEPPVYVTRALKGGSEDLPIEEGRVLGIVSSHRVSGLRRAAIVIRALWQRRVGRRVAR